MRREDMVYVGFRHLSQEATSSVLLRSIRPIMNAVVEHGGFETVKTTEDVDRLDKDIGKELQNGTKLGFDFLWAWGRRM
jgi:hypothetical protein